MIILEYKWHILLFAEIAGWVLTLFLFFARYYFQSTLFSWGFIILIAISDYLPSITLPIIDAIYTNDIERWVYEGGLLFNLVVLGLFIFSATLGKKYALILDRKIMAFVRNLKGKNEEKNSLQ